MDNSNRNSSGSCEDNSSNEDLTKNQKTISPNRERAKKFLQKLSKHFGRPRRYRNDFIYNSQEDLHSSSTDSFSLSLEQALEKHARSSSIDLSSEDRSSRTCSTSSPPSSSSSSCSSSSTPAFTYENDGDDEISTYRAFKATDYLRNDDEDCNRQQAAALKNVNLSRISIMSLSRVIQTMSASNRSLSCKFSPKKTSTTATTTAAADSTVEAKNTKNATAKKSQQQKPPQRILRQPVNYVYLKGMSGLPTRRVPRSSLCCVYAYR